MTQDPNKNEILEEISQIKKEVNSISTKVDIMLEILNTFALMIEEEEEEEEGEELEESYDSDESWLPDEDDDFWKNN
jgi:hypothetical protein